MKINTYMHTLHYITLHYITLHYITIQYNTIQYNTIQYNTIQYNTIQYNTIQYNIHYITLHYVTLHCITIHIYIYMQTFVFTKIHIYINRQIMSDPKISWHPWHMLHCSWSRTDSHQTNQNRQKIKVLNMAQTWRSKNYRRFGQIQNWLIHFFGGIQFF